MICLIISVTWCRWKLTCTGDTGFWTVAVWLSQGNVTFCFWFVLWQIFRDPLLGVKGLKHWISIPPLTGDKGRINRLFLKAIKNTTWYWTFSKSLMKTHGPLFLTPIYLLHHKGTMEASWIEVPRWLYRVRILKIYRLSNCLFVEFCEMLKKKSLCKIHTCTLLKTYLPRENKCFELNYCDFRIFQSSLKEKKHIFPRRGSI